jgi:hypothetical protein
MCLHLVEGGRRKARKGRKDEERRRGEGKGRQEGREGELLIGPSRHVL